jgi:hypothetical protein
MIETQAYLDDVLIGRNTEEECIVNTVRFIEISTKYKLILNQKKSKFVKTSVAMLGYIQDGNGIRIHPSKVKAIVNCQRPTTGQEIRRFMGLVNWPRKLVPNIAMIGQRLDDLRDQKKIVWSKELELSFNEVKTAIVNAVSVVTEREGAVILLGTDASLEGLSFWRGQAKEFEKLKPEELTKCQIEIIEYGSKAIKIEDTLLHAGATMRELTAVIFAFKKMFGHLQGKKFILFTDQAALVYLFSKMPRSPLILRWVVIIMQLRFDSVHWLGSTNIIADALSRRSCTPAEHAHVPKKEVFAMEMIEDLIKGKVGPLKKEDKLKIIASGSDLQTTVDTRHLVEGY